MIIRVFPSRTSYTPTDPHAFVGDPPMWRPKADEVHVSCAFTWDIDEALRLQKAWGQYYETVRLSGPALMWPWSLHNIFTVGFYVKHGITFTSRGCNNNCPWCLVPNREGKLRTIPITPGHIVQDNNLLQAPRTHIEEVFRMLRSQKRAASFPGGIDSTLLRDWHVEELQSLTIAELFLAADHDGALRPLERAVAKLQHLREHDQLRCYVLLAYNGESMEKGLARLERVWEIGAMPFAMLYQPEDEYIEYPQIWTRFARSWQRPAVMKAMHKGGEMKQFRSQQLKEEAEEMLK